MPKRSLPPVLWSLGVSQWADCAGDPGYWRRGGDNHETEEYFEKYYGELYGVVWISIGSHGDKSDINMFASVLDRLKRPIVLITTDGDSAMPSDLDPLCVEKIVNHPLILQWFTQNYDGSANRKIQGIPIGLDLHTQRDTDLDTPEKLLTTLSSIRDNSLPIADRERKIGCDLHLNLDHIERLNVARKFYHAPFTDFLIERTSQRKVWEYYARFPMVFSTHGNGLDCHRTWELLKLGCIVVTKTSALDPLYIGLPVVIVKDWAECGTPGFIEHHLELLAPLTHSDNIDKRLSTQYWIDKARQYLDAPQPMTMASTQVSGSDIAQPHVLIGTPAYGGQLHTDYLHSILNFSNNKILFDLVTIDNESLITRARNTIISTFWASGKHTHLLFLDADVYLDYEGLQNMLSHQKDVVGAPVYLKGKTESGDPILNTNLNTNANPNQHPVLQSVQRVGTAALLLSHQAIGSLIRKAISENREYIVHELLGHPNTPNTHYDIFRVGVSNNEYLSEDFWVCQDLHELGYEIFVDTSVYTRHNEVVAFD